ncbi:MAG: carboxypeptidase-like regulatory domain-containing protein, partial [Gemmatimonadota bacterium]
MKRLLLFAIALALFADHSLAQVVHGTVTESDRGTPLAGAFVVLLDTAGVQRGATLTDAEGRFVLRARTGRFKVRAELIGHQSVTSPFFVVPASGPVVSNVVLPIAPIELEAVSVAGDRRCRVRPESGAQTARLWEEA